ncbi:VOC family protein [Pukyongia salina]|uniref:VOC family protein n=1 Tax=Pukyongia salina TaxID=2094025 RepID=A0A2S0HWQ4_9FLAO|nr:VOC family protein [Pukyongia salina]AVI51117.1 VOC family protein [Pukyongia salina]
MATINSYITFNGNCEEAFNLYRSVFGGEFATISKFRDMPDDPKYPVSEEDKDKIMHVSLPISQETVLMGSDTGAEWGKQFKQGNNFSISINANSREEADTFFKALSQDGEVVMPMSDTFWESYFGMLTDRFGIQWMVSYDDPSRVK